jgi:suppressor for copper-sensitivity B
LEQRNPSQENVTMNISPLFALVRQRVIAGLLVAIVGFLGLVAFGQIVAYGQILEPGKNIDKSRTVLAGAQDEEEEAEAPLPKKSKQAKPKFSTGGLGTFAGELGDANPNAGGSSHTLAASFELEKGTRRGRLSVTMELEPGWHTYSTTQPKMGALPTRITIADDSKKVVTLEGDFVADKDYTAKETELIPGKVFPTQEYDESVTWTAPISFADGVDIRKAKISVDYDGQVCRTSCIPVEEVLEAEFTGEYEAPPKEEESFTDGIYQGSEVSIRGFIEADSFTPGSQASLVIELVPQGTFHTYQMDAPPKVTKPGLPTILGLTELAGLTPGTVTADQAPIKGKETPHHVGKVTWTLPLTIPQDVKSGDATIRGVLGYQLCDERQCLLPAGATFEAKIPLGSDRGQQVQFTWAEGDYGDANTAYKATPLKIDNVTRTKSSSPNVIRSAEPPHAVPAESRDLTPMKVESSNLFVNFLLGMLGGFILNFMPCVLPVIGIKILSFAEQAGKSVWKVTAYNLAYTLGLLAVFWTLATFAALPGVFFEDSLIWGELFGFTSYRIGMIALVFTMALSFLGVWEIPLPGVVGSGKAVDLQSQEGLVGAFFKGIFTTILATPCSGPFLGPVFGYASAQPAYVVYIIFTGVGLGMALPYLLIGWFPVLMKVLPKPGPWMDTFKQLMGFVLLGVVVWLFSTLSQSLVVPTLAFVVALWFGCWLIGQVPVWETTRKQFGVWAGAIAVAVITGYFAFTGRAGTVGGRTPGGSEEVKDNSPPGKHLYEWVTYSEEALEKARAEGKTVMIDFTADWCNNCQLNFYSVLNTETTKKLVEDNGIVPMLADFTDRPAHIKKKLREFQQASIPFLVIYPGDGGQPIPLPDLITRKTLEDRLQAAGPSKASEEKSVKTKSSPSDQTAHESELRWSSYSEEALEKARRDGRTVLVDFTAKWCLTCNAVVWPALQTEQVVSRVKSNNVLTMIADYTDRPDHIKRKLVEFNQRGLPLVLVYPADGSEPFVLRDAFGSDSIAKALDRAGPSKVVVSKSPKSEQSAKRTKLQWSQYSEPALKNAVRDGRTVLINFTAAWDNSAHLITWPALNSDSVVELMNANNVLPMIADFTDRPNDLKSKMREFQSAGGPLMLVYPADGSSPIVIRDYVGEADISKALETAGPSKDRLNEMVSMTEPAK